MKTRRDVVKALTVAGAAAACLSEAGVIMVRAPSGAGSPQESADATANAQETIALQDKGQETKALQDMDQEVNDPVAQDPPWKLVAPYRAGALVAPGWYMHELNPIADGSAIVCLKSDKQRYVRFRICRNDGKPLGITHTSNLDLFLINSGNGSTPTEEALTRLALSLARGIKASSKEQLSLLKTYTELYSIQR